MAKQKISELVEELLCDFLSDNGLELYNCEFVKEGKDWFLRVFVDKLQNEGDEQLYVSTDDCEKVSRFLSNQLDELDPIEQNYYLEVSSPGLDRALIKERDFQRFSGSLVDVSLYKAIDGRKNFQGTLLGLEDGNILVEIEKGNVVRFEKSQAAKIKLAVVF